jgi:acyl dehydratase
MVGEVKNKFAPELLLAMPPIEEEQTYTPLDTILYNLGIGLDAAAVDDDALLHYVLEEGLMSFPTMVCVLATTEDLFHEPRYGINFEQMVHGEEHIEILAPLPASGTVRSLSRIDSVWDRGVEKGAVLKISRTLYDADGTPLAKGHNILMLRGNGGFGGSSAGMPQSVPIPTRDPDGSANVGIRREQALIYRLSGDRNPLHTVPAVARAAGFPGPIIQGLCSFGTTARALVAEVAGNDAAKLRSFGLRFASPVYPGETLRVEYWRLGGGSVAFQARVAERDVLVLKGGRATFAS